MSDALDEIVLALAERLLEEGLVDRSPQSLALEEELQDAGADAVPFWLALLDNEALECRTVAVFNLARLAAPGGGGGTDVSPGDPGAEAVLPEEAVGALARHALEDPEPKLRKASGAAVAEARGPGAAALLAELAEDPSEEVAAWAAQARAALPAGAAAAAARVRDLVDYDVDEHIARVLMSGNTAEAPEGFVAAQRYNLKARRDAAAFAARVAGGAPDARDLVDPAALARYVRDDPDEEVRATAARALDALVPPPPGPAPGVPLVRWLRDRGFLRARDAALLRLVAPLSAAPAGGGAEPHVRAILSRLTGAERLPAAPPPPSEDEPRN